MVSSISPEFLAALPPNIQEEVRASCIILRLSIEQLHVMSLLMSYDGIKLNFHTMSLPIFSDISNCPEKSQINLKV